MINKPGFEFSHPRLFKLFLSDWLLKLVQVAPTYLNDEKHQMGRERRVENLTFQNEKTDH
jgi:hypothetical protein